MRAARTDATQKAVVSALRKAGCLVLPLHRVGGGCPDLLVQYKNRLNEHWYEKALCFTEVKTPTGKLRTAQERFIAQGWRVAVVRSPDEALAAVGLL